MIFKKVMLTSFHRQIIKIHLIKIWEDKSVQKSEKLFIIYPL